MSSSPFDETRPPEPPRRRRRRRRGPRRGWGGGGDGSREAFMVPDVEFASYYDKPVVKAPPWGHEVAAYLVLGGIAGGSGLLGLGAQIAGLPKLRRNTRLSALGAVIVGGAALVADLGRPDRFYNMLRTFKVTSPMSVGSWILASFGAGAGITAVAELDRLSGERVPLGPLRKLLQLLEGPAGVEAGIMGTPLAAYTAVLLSDTAVPTWNAMHRDLPFVFVSSASLAASGLAMITTPTAQTRPARALAVLGVLGDVVAMRWTESQMDPTAAEPLHHGHPGAMLRWSERLAILGGIGALLGGGWRPTAVLSGAALVAASTLTRFGVFEAGLESTKDPRYTVVPQKRRLAKRRAEGVVDDSITTAG
ncbi:NrfD/PsrC family molybdoenzyme membrane anchor subunit [Naumannella halotolerans]|uniref:Formate-dependent nitrite reductase membrane component NrfD n=1 Tax=Naumannella halotolerans TaxID=993414 RepID=A0A4R7JCD8_9ACTN|nr:NrfD/PsrC family molybdoenzyme membrane anchor subunit [Naumannella halotolerans]TDT34367.1 formate-dependent nitrite reductase membrane component NrfD [Naumannella halotolerans]